LSWNSKYRAGLAALVMIGLGTAATGGLPRIASAEGQLSSEKSHANPHEAGMKIYKEANCVGCHKWHGDGGGGYGGAALSLRKTELNREQIIEVVSCGRPNTGMPYHERNAYAEGHCYGLSEKDLGDSMPPKAPNPLRRSEIEAVADYVLQAIKGHGEPTLEECVAFWGEESKMCNPYRAASDGAGSRAAERKP
jgi:mono/diheme cytochrome c family protein